MGLLPNLQYPLINGNRVDYGAIEITLGLGLGVLPVKGIREISYNSGMEPGDVYGTSPQMLGQTLGQYKAEGSVSFYREEWDAFLGTLNNILPNGIMQIRFDIMIAYSLVGIVPVRTDKLLGCRIKKIDHTMSQGNEALVTKCDLAIIQIQESDLLPFVGMIK